MDALTLTLSGGLLLSIIAGGWALYKWGSATGNAEAKHEKDARISSEAAVKSTRETHSVLSQIQRDVAAMPDDAVRDKLRSKYPLPK